ncbi:MAG: hypothetical protein Fur0010_13280 [Bdellovibrio sp.]
MTRKNHSSIKFLVAEELGDWMGIIIPIFFPKENRFEFKYLHHKDHDGISMMTELMEEQGLKITNFPTLKVSNQPSRRHRLSLLKKYIALTKKVPMKWNQKIDCTGRPLSFAHIYLDRQTTKDLYDLAHKQEVSLTSYLLFHLDKIVYSNLLSPESERKWVLPLNMRTNPLERKMGNHSASIIINVTKKDSIQNIHHKMTNFLKSQLQWGSYTYSNMAKYIGHKGTKLVAKRIKDIGTGVFSNLGKWPIGIEGKLPTHLQSQAWSVVAPASQVLPVASALIDWDGQISLTLQLHPSLKISKEENLELARQWIQSALHDNYQFRPFELRLFSYDELKIPNFSNT